MRQKLLSREVFGGLAVAMAALGMLAFAALPSPRSESRW